MPGTEEAKKLSKEHDGKTLSSDCQCGPALEDYSKPKPVKPKAFIGCKIIHAEEMTKNTFISLYKRGERDIPQPGEDDAHGYHVTYPNQNGTVYHSWSPKDVFERVYREVCKDEESFVVMASNLVRNSDGGVEQEQ